MVEFFCGARLSTPAHRILQTAVAFTLFCVLASLSASAQNGTGRNNAQAVLHIRINVVPAVLAPPRPPEHQSTPLNGVSYNISTSQPNVEMIEETRPMTDPTGRGQEVILKTLTIVPR